MPPADAPERFLDWCLRHWPRAMARLDHMAEHGSPAQQDFALGLLAKLVAEPRVVVGGKLVTLDQAGD